MPIYLAQAAGDGGIYLQWGLAIAVAGLIYRVGRMSSEHDRGEKDRQELLAKTERDRKELEASSAAIHRELIETRHDLGNKIQVHTLQITVIEQDIKHLQEQP